MKYLLIPLYLAGSYLIPWDKLSIHEALPSNVLYDILYISLVSKYLGINYRYKVKFQPTDIYLFLGTVILASASLFILKRFGIINPFIYVGHLFLNLVLIGPIIEEYIFRGIFNNIISFNSSRLRHISSGVIFSLAHALSLIDAPDMWKSFFYLQVIYTFFLGLICSISFDRSKLISKPLILHIVFNLIFYVVTVAKLV